MTNQEWKRVDELVESLGCSIAEAKQIIEDDKKVDKGEHMGFDLDETQEKQALKMANVRERKKPLNFQRKERKADTAKEGVIQQIFNFLVENGYMNTEITNKSKLISFSIGEEAYELNLIRKRKPKESKEGESNGKK